MEPIINCDWLQIHCDASRLKSRYYGYNVETKDVRTRTFAKLMEISRDGRHIAQLQYQPHSPKLPRGCSILKIENYILYSTSRADIIRQLIEDFDLITIGTTRIDIAGDFQRIADRSPETLVNDILTGNVIRIGHSKQTVIGDDQLTAYGHRRWQYLRYGSRSSRISAYLYNKTRELSDVSDKPYIRAIWAANGFAKYKRDTWRLEFSIKGRQMHYIEEDTGEVIPNDWRRLLDDAQLSRLYWALCRHYFRLAIPDHTRRTNSTLLPLWRDRGQSNVLVKYLDASRHNNRADKIFLRKLINMADELQDPDIIRMATDLAKRYATAKDLDQWRAAQLLQYRYSDNLF